MDIDIIEYRGNLGVLCEKKFRLEGGFYVFQIISQTLITTAMDSCPVRQGNI